MLKNCCCFSLKTGSIVCGAINLVVSTLFLVAWIWTTVTADIVTWTWLDITYMLAAIINVVVSILLLYGSIKEGRWLLMPWMVFDCIALGFFTILVIIFTVLLAWQMVLFLLLLIPGWFFWVVVMSFFVDLRDREGSGKGYQVSRSQPTTHSNV